VGREAENKPSEGPEAAAYQPQRDQMPGVLPLDHLLYPSLPYLHDAAATATGHHESLHQKNCDSKGWMLNIFLKTSGIKGTSRR
jgi:hypothetical protein